MSISVEQVRSIESRLTLPVSFDDVPYFKNQFRGDLVVARGVIYYFPHTNVEAERSRKKIGPADAIDFGAQFLGTIGEFIGLFGLGKAVYNRTENFRRKLRKPTINRPRLCEKGLWPVNGSRENIERLLDAYIAAEKSNPPQLTDYQFSLPKPMRFSHSQVNRMRVKFGSLRFDTEFDNHDFTVGLRRQKLLREALREGEFL